MNDYSLLFFYVLATLGTAMTGAKLSGAVYDSLIGRFGWRSSYRKISRECFAFASVVLAAAIIGGYGGVLYLLGGMQSMSALTAMMALVGVWSLVYGAVLSCASLAGIRILPAQDQSCTASDHAVLRHYASFNGELERCNRCGTFVTR